MPRPSRQPATTLPTLLGHGVRRLATRLVAGARLLLWQRPQSTVPTRVLFAPETMVVADPDVAADIYAGVFALEGEVVDVAGGSPFVLAPPSTDWARALHSFSWLHHLEANAEAAELSSSNARALFDEWLPARSASDDIANEPTVMADRLVNWLVQSPLLLNGADAGFRQRYVRALGRQMRRLERTVTLLPPGVPRLRAIAALALAGTVIADQARLARWALALLGDGLEEEILSDGGHASRSPQALVATLEALVPLREALMRRQLAVPRALGDALDRAMPMLRFFQHGDGALAHFHGTGAVPAMLVEEILAYDDADGRPADNARHSGFQRLAAGATAILVDTGCVPPPAFAAAAHASALAFEMSSGGFRIVVNCGALERARPQWAAAARATAAHSTLVVADTSSARMLSRGPLARVLGPLAYAGPRQVAVRRQLLAVEAEHDGYADAFGLTHVRRLALSDDGQWLDGEDRLVGRARLDGVAYAVRFHLDPAVKVRLDRRNRQALLTLPDGALWLFVLDHGPELTLEDTVVLAAPRRVRRSLQLVVPGNTLTDEAVRWHIARRAGPLGPTPADAAADFQPPGSP